MKQDRGNSSRRQKKYLAKKEAILESAIAIFSLKGFNRTSIEEIADGADFGKGSIYHYFNSKEEILDSIVSNETEKLLKIIESIAKEETPPLIKLERLITNIMVFLQENSDFFTITMRHFFPLQSAPDSPIASPYQRYCSFFEKQNRIICDILRESQKADLILEMDIHELSIILTGMINNSILYWIKKRPSKDFVEWMNFGNEKNPLGNYFQKRVQGVIHIFLNGIKE